MNEFRSTQTCPVEALRRIDLLATLADGELELLVPLTCQQAIARRRHVFLPDEPARSIYFLIEGTVRIARLSRDGKEITLDLRVAGDLFGEQALAGGALRESLCEVIEDATVGTIERGAFAGFVRQRPLIAQRLIELLARRQHECGARIEELAFRDVPPRLARLLLRLAGAHGEAVPEGTAITVPLTHQEVANLIGATRETTTATLNGFRRGGFVKLGRKRIVITDHARLEAVALVEEGNGNGRRPVRGGSPGRRTGSGS